MNRPTDVLFAMTGDVHRNARALRQLRALDAEGLSVTLLALRPGDLRTELPGSVTPVYVDAPAAGGPRFFASVHRNFAAEARSRGAAVYHASDLYVLRALDSAARRHGARLTYDSRELYTHVSGTEGKPLARRFWRAFEAGPIRRSSLVLTVSDAIADHLAAVYGIDRPAVQFNAPEIARPAPAPDPSVRRRAGISDDEFVFVHLGQMRDGRGGDAVVRASASLRGAVVLFLGYGPARPRLEALARELAAPVRFADPVPPDRIPAVLRAADVGLAFLEDTCLNHRYALPNKLFDYFAAGLPVLASRLPEMSRIVDRFAAGLVVDPSDRVGLAGAMRRAASDPAAVRLWGEGARAAAETFDWASASQAFRALMRARLPLAATPAAIAR